MGRMKHNVEGVELRKTFGVGSHRCVATLSDIVVIFTPTLGRYNNKVNGWKWKTRDPVVCGWDEYDHSVYIGGSAATLHGAVITAGSQAVNATRIAHGLRPLTEDEIRQSHTHRV